MKSLIAKSLLIGLAVVTVGCSATKDEVTKQIEEVNREITSLRASNAVLKDRLDMLESAPKAERVGSDETHDASSDRPNLEVVHLSPEEQPTEAAPVVAAPIDDSPPMVIVGDDKGVEEVDTEASDPKAKQVGYPKAQVPNKRGR